jgi:anti-sigma factor RsiW
MSEPPRPDDRPDEPDDAMIAALSDYLDGTLASAERGEIERRLAEDPGWKRAHDELARTRQLLSGLRKTHAPSSFAEGVAQTIHQRSAGRFFARRTLGDRVPFGALVALAIAGILALTYILWSSSTGSLKLDREPGAPHGSAAVTPPPPGG